MLYQDSEEGLVIICLCVRKNKIQETIPLKNHVGVLVLDAPRTISPPNTKHNNNTRSRAHVDQVHATKCATCRSTQKQALIWSVRTLRLKNAIECEGH